jgi:hypothetical protein
MATRYWVGGGATANWTATGNTNWGSASNTQDNASVPGVGDDVIFDGVGTGASNSTISASIGIKSLVMTGYANTLTHNTSVTLTIGSAGQTGGACTFAAGMTYTRGNATSSALAFDADGGTNTFTSAGKTFSNVTVGTSNLGGTVSLADALTLNNGATLTLTRGTLNFNNQNVSAAAFSSSNTNVRTLTMGSGTISLTSTAAANLWDMTTATNLTLNENTSTIEYSGVATANQGFVGGGETYYAVHFNRAAANARLVTISGSNTFTNLTFTNTRYVQITAGTTQTISGVLTFDGTTNTPSVLTTNTGVVATLSVANAATLSWLSIGGITKSGAGSITANSSYDLGNNTSITINAPSTGGGAGLVMG